MTRRRARVSEEGLSRRVFLKSAMGASVLAPAALPTAPAQRETYETHAKGIRILPGQWRPHYPWEHIAWVSPAWPSQDYLWLDFPEAIFSDQGLLYLSHINPQISSLFPNLPKAPWRLRPGGVTFDRRLPNGIRFGGSVTRQDDVSVALELRLHNGSRKPLTRITLQTCAYLRGIREFAEFTRDNKFIHVASRGWVSVSEARDLPATAGPYRLGWRTKGKLLADLPMIVTVSNQEERLVAMTWQKDTLSMVSNPNHPCMHADPQFNDLQPGERASIHGRLIFFEGKLSDFDYRKYLAG